MSRAASKYRVLSLFSGAGGLDAGLEATRRFETVGFIEKIPAFASTLRLNIEAGRLGAKDARVWNADISQLNPVEVMDELGVRPGELDVIAGGPPCQTFSTAGRRGTLQDARGLLLWEYLRFVEAFRPKYFVLENVRGLLSAGVSHRPIKERPDKGGAPLRPDEEPGSVVALWLEDLRSSCGGEYRVDCFEVNSANYGAPQIRERVLFFGNRGGRLLDFPEPTHSNRHTAGGTEQLVLGQQQLMPFRTLGDALSQVGDDDGEVMDFSPRKKSFLSQVPEGANWRSLPVEVQQESMGRAWHAKGGRSGWWRRLTRDLPSPTVVTMPNHASTAMCHPTETRALSLRECAAIQEFPCGWDFAGTTAEKYTQVGNALPIRLASVAGKVLAGALDTPLAPQESLPSYRKVYLKSHVRTRQWYKAGQTFIWRDGEDNHHAHYSAAGRG